MAEKLLKILFVLPEFHPEKGGGIITFYEHLLPALHDKCELKVVVGSGYTQSLFKGLYKDIPVEYLEPERFKKHLNLFGRFEFVPQFRRNLAAAYAIHEQVNGGKGYDLIECTDFGLGYIPWVLDQQKPVLVRLHGSTGQINYYDPSPSENFDATFSRQAELLTLPLSTELQTHSFLNQSFWQHKLSRPIVNRRPVFSVPPETDIIPFENRSKQGIVTGRLQYWKGVLTMLSSLEIKADSFPIHWYGRDMIYGKNQLMSEYVENKHPRVWSRQFFYHNPPTHSIISELQGKSLFGVVPSIWDVYNMSCLELMSRGTPVIVSKGAGCSQLIKHKDNGLVFEPGNPEQLANGLDFLRNISSSEYRRLSHSAWKTVSTELHPDIVSPEYLRDYMRIVQNFNPVQLDPFFKDTYSHDKQLHVAHDVLRHISLKTLANHVAKRLLKKISV